MGIGELLPGGMIPACKELAYSESLASSSAFSFS